MRINVVFTAQECKPEKIDGKNAVVIDVLRATTVITTSLMNGAASVIPFGTVEEALNYAGKDEKVYVLGGERDAIKIEGFDFGNSPLEYTREAIEGKELIITTTNGTTALERAKSARNLYAMCFLNCGAVSRKLLEQGVDTVLVCAGTKGEFSTDDCLCAGMCLDYLCRNGRDIELDDAGRFVRDFYNAFGSDIKYALRDSRHCNYLIEIGMGADVDYCLQTDLTDVVPLYLNGKILRRPNDQN